MSDDGKIVVVTSQKKIIVDELQSDGTYLRVQGIVYADALSSGTITFDGEVLVVGFFLLTRADIYRRQDGMYVKVQEIDDSTHAVFVTAFTKDKTKVALTGYEPVVRIYELIDGQYTFLQSVPYIGSIISLALSHDRMIVNTVGSISYFLHTGTEYSTTPQYLSNPESMLISMGYVENFEMLGCGGTGSVLYLYDFVNETYMEKSTEVLPAYAMNINIDETKMYYIVMLFDGTFNMLNTKKISVRFVTGELFFFHTVFLQNYQLKKLLNKNTRTPQHSAYLFLNYISI